MAHILFAVGAGDRLEFRFLHTELIHGEIDKAQGQGRRTILHPIVPVSRINELRIRHDGMNIPAALALQL